MTPAVRPRMKPTIPASENPARTPAMVVTARTALERARLRLSPIASKTLPSVSMRIANQRKTAMSWVIQPAA